VYKKIYGPYENKPKFICPLNILQPKSRGTVRLNSSNPCDLPLIDPDYFGDPRDIDVFIQGLKMCEKIAKSEPMKRVGTNPFKTVFPGCEEFFGDEDHYFECIIRGGVMSLSHPTGTAKMGDPRDPTTVVDPFLRVKGVKGLRVVDASVMPIIPSGSPNAPVIMVAEKAADIIRNTIDCPKYGFETDISFL
ncbi:Glucose dehydrogenase [FAD, quinone], partial [Araneus ventricosus]